MCHKPDISMIYRSKTDISAIYRSSSISCQTSPISDISEVDIVSNSIDIGYIGDISMDISDIFIPGWMKVRLKGGSFDAGGKSS